jgi:hypothetical protein
MEEPKITENRFPLRPRKRIVLGCIGFFLISCVFIVMIAAFMVNSFPFYHELKIPLPSKYVDTVRSTFTWSDGINYFIWRQQMSVYEPEFSTWDSVVSYFDKSLIAQGWVKYQEDDGWYPCNAYLPEAEFLPLGQDGYIFYRRPDARIFQADATVCLAVWPLPSRGFNVVLQTHNPSPLAAFRSDVV